MTRESQRGRDALANKPPQRLEGRWRLTDGPRRARVHRVRWRWGSARFVAIDGTLDCKHGRRNGRPHVAFIWQGTDECDAVRGRGWTTLRKDGCLTGRILIENGDDSGFIAELFDDDGEHGDLEEKAAAHPRRRRAPLRRGRS